MRLTHDTIYNLHDLSYDLEGFVKVIVTYPDLLVVCGLAVLLKEMDMVLRVNFKTIVMIALSFV
jgi:hypothetical protein